jgi:hypothetical protein
MTIVLTFCNAVIDGSTFQTEGGSLIKLAKVATPSIDEPNFEAPKEELEKLILYKLIAFEEISISDSYIVANVWVASLHVNNHMQKLFPSKEIT